MNLFSRKKPAPEIATPQIVTNGRFELEHEGQVAYLEYTIAGHVLALIHSEIPGSLRGSGVGSTLAKTAFDWARDNHMKVDVVCPFVAAYLENHPEYSDLVLR
jgi:predicted GNAT family acetyltransferase